MSYIHFNNNPIGRRTGDCSVRAISKALNLGWEAAHLMLDINAIGMNLEGLQVVYKFRKGQMNNLLFFIVN